ncbi:thiamine pyrophosphate-dependent enzyme [Spirochaetota bacterium]
MGFETLMGDEAIALGAIHAGLGSAFAYPGTPSTEIMETLQFLAEKQKAGKLDGVKEAFNAQWCANEKTAYESAIGSSYAGKRAMVSMKHVGLNVAMDPFVNSSLLDLHAGLVVVIADDPGMHSSQDEQDSRWLADFARVPCFEPATQQEAYDMTREAFEVSERFNMPVMLRITTRLAHSRATVKLGGILPQGKVKKPSAGMDWVLMPGIARKRWHAVLEKTKSIKAFSNDSSFNPVTKGQKKLGVITAGLALAYYQENLEEVMAANGGQAPYHLHVGLYPIPEKSVLEVYEACDEVLVLEDGYPYIERLLRGIVKPSKRILGKESGELPLEGELDPDNIRPALGLKARAVLPVPKTAMPGRPPQLCQGCPHVDTVNAIKEALQGHSISAVFGDIGCSTLAALPPYNLIEATVEMGASVGMARGASISGLKPSIAVIGDSTFYHSGIGNILDAVQHNSPFTVVIADNLTTAMTGAQPTIVPSSKMEAVVKGLGVDPAHIRVLKAHRSDHETNVRAIKEEIEHNGPSVIIMVRECIESYKKARKP